jgi:hypothetical protein
MVAIDCLSAVLVWIIGRRLYDDRVAQIAAFAYAVSPLTSIAAVRVGPDPVITALGLLGLSLLLHLHTRIASVLAGICLALAVWVKFPALLFLPIYLTAVPHRLRPLLLGFMGAFVLLFAPFFVDMHVLYRDTVAWQLYGRGGSDLLHRVASVGTYWLGLNAVALVAVVRRAGPLWLRLGFCLGAVFLGTAHAYYHYFVPIVPFAALLAAPMIVGAYARSRWLLSVAALAVSLLWAVDVAVGPPAARLFITAERVSSAQQAATVIDRITGSQSSIVTDQFEYALLSHRRIGDYYFWNMDNTISAVSLERHLSGVTAVVQTRNDRHGFPPGFVDYLEDRRIPHVQTPDAVIWLVGARE